MIPTSAGNLGARVLLEELERLAERGQRLRGPAADPLGHGRHRPAPDPVLLTGPAEYKPL